MFSLGNVKTFWRDFWPIFLEYDNGSKFARGPKSLIHFRRKKIKNKTPVLKMCSRVLRVQWCTFFHSDDCSLYKLKFNNTLQSVSRKLGVRKSREYVIMNSNYRKLILVNYLLGLKAGSGKGWLKAPWADVAIASGRNL